MIHFAGFGYGGDQNSCVGGSCDHAARTMTRRENKDNKTMMTIIGNRNSPWPLGLEGERPHRHSIVNTSQRHRHSAMEAAVTHGNVSPCRCLLGRSLVLPACIGPDVSGAARFQSDALIPPRSRFDIPLMYRRVRVDGGVSLHTRLCPPVLLTSLICRRKYLSRPPQKIFALRYAGTAQRHRSCTKLPRLRNDLLCVERGKPLSVEMDERTMSICADSAALLAHIEK